MGWEGGQWSGDGGECDLRTIIDWVENGRREPCVGS